MPDKYKKEKNIIFFLAQTPAGISIFEIELLCKIYKSWFGLAISDFLSEFVVATIK